MPVEDVQYLAAALVRCAQAAETLSQAKTHRVLIICGTVAVGLALGATCYLVGHAS